MESEIKKLGQQISKSLYQSGIDRLTDAELEELKVLSECDGDVSETAMSRMFPDGKYSHRMGGLYDELLDLGLISGYHYLGGKLIVDGITERGHWAIERNQLMKEAETKRVASQRKHDYRVSVISSVVGGLLGILGTVLGILIGLNIG